MLPMALFTRLLGHLACGEVFHMYKCISQGHRPAAGSQDRVSWVEAATMAWALLKNFSGHGVDGVLYKLLLEFSISYSIYSLTDFISIFNS